ncbi:hypothetical protein TSAR_007390 [Trichomalopsis sarcophagae]|uniref:HTTM-like domain-containing protein n=1 Tax=Trichomalopsis sarcophagae TaxID=543379 RepID=A0A232ER06_9HYME|nr:hypothetical protein TSAR_007390 [Trichomalopsis sarcophagae]
MKRRFGTKSMDHSDEDSAVEETKVKLLPRKARETFEQLCGFACDDLRSFGRLTTAMYRPTDPACLGVCRALFGLCMVLDVVEERGLAIIDLKWGDPNGCHFPLIHGLRPLELPWMIVLYSVMWLGAFGIMLGYRFKLACGLFVLPYWYLFLVDKSYWNNHSYLYGVVSLLFWGTGADRYFAIDAKKSKEKSVPYWNYFILKFQFFALYFIAGLKKSSREWLEGYAMTNLSRHWVFEPFKLVLSSEQTDFYIVHWFGFIFDLTVGFFMIFDATRLPAMFFCTAFHLMNSRLFSIGMFPYVCLATMPLFCRVDWPRKLLEARTHSREKLDDGECSSRKSRDYFAKDNEAESDVAGRDEGSVGRRSEKRRVRVSRKQKLVVATLLLHVGLQFFLPYSHFLTKGYNNWVPGLYGYSWDMMVHAWDTVLVVVKVRDNESQRDYFLDPGAWVPNDRWAKHGDMARQYAHCIKDNLQKLKGRASRTTEPWAQLSSNLSIYMDVWCSLNGRFQQRLFDPNADMLSVDWHPLKPVSYVMPLLRQFSSYRSELERIEQDVFSWSNYTDVLFVADYPGMRLENYVDSELANVSLSVLEGEVSYRDEEEARARTIGKGGTARIETGRFHKVETTSPHPACYMYTFANQTKQQLASRGISEPRRVKEALPLLKEIGYKVDAFGRALGHVANALLHLTLGVPMIRRIPLD